ncbi:MAG TPA: BREX system ATP-binding domain-containing protein, partial [Roseiflexaceae bacterium]
FKLLLLAPQRQLLKDRVLDLLWPDKSPETAANNLHRTLFILRRVLQPDLENANQSHYLLCKDDMIALHAATIAWVDAEEFVRLIRLGRQQNHNLEHYDAALALYKGEFLPEDVYENWAESQRGVLHKHYVDLLKQVTAIHTERAAYPKAIGNLHALLSLDPTDEAVQRELMRLYAQIGERHKALRLYQQSSQALRDELGVEPSAQTTDLYESILHETLPARFEPLAAAPGEESPAAGEEAYHIPLVGRQAELQQLVEQLGQAQRGHGSMVFLVGEQGVGKTRLAKELVAHARAAGVKTLQGSAFEGEGRLLYAPFVESLRRGLNPQTLDRARQRLGLLVNDLARLLPELLGSAPAGAARPNAAINRLDIAATGQEQRRLFEATAATYALLAQSTPLLLWLENLHAAGDSSLQMLHYLARQIRNQRILVVCTVDQSKLQRGTPISLMLYELQRNHLVERINLARLDPEDVTQLCVHLLDESVRDSNLPAMVYELTGGNPFFVRELVLSLIKIGTIERRNGAWRLPPDAAITIPPNIQEITGARLGQLSGDAYSLLGVAAVIGNEFDYE